MALAGALNPKVGGTSPGSPGPLRLAEGPAFQSPMQQGMEAETIIYFLNVQEKVKGIKCICVQKEAGET